MRGITKRLPGVMALNNVDLDAVPGEVHALVGENGAGKSTLMKILAGVYLPDTGEIEVGGEVVRFSHPRQAQAAGVSIIYQELNLLPERTVAQNIFVGREPTKGFVVDTGRMEEETAGLLADLGVSELDLIGILDNHDLGSDLMLMEIADKINIGPQFRKIAEAAFPS